MGLAVAMTDREANRVLLPVRCTNGTAWVARDMTGRSKAKYLAPLNSNEDFKHLLIQSPGYVPGGDLLVVEGGFDVARLYEHEMHSWGLLGSTLHNEQLNMFFALPAYTRIMFGLDPNVPRSKIDAMCAKLTIKFSNLFTLDWPQGTDPGSSTKEQARSAVHNAKRWGHCAPINSGGLLGG